MEIKGKEEGNQKKGSDRKKINREGKDEGTRGRVVVVVAGRPRVGRGVEPGPGRQIFSGCRPRVLRHDSQNLAMYIPSARVIILCFA